jgi:hypothetical protein
VREVREVRAQAGASDSCREHEGFGPPFANLPPEMLPEMLPSLSFCHRCGAGITDRLGARPLSATASRG